MLYNQPLVGGLSVHWTPARHIHNLLLPGGSTRCQPLLCDIAARFIAVRRRRRVDRRVSCSVVSSFTLYVTLYSTRRAKFATLSSSIGRVFALMVSRTRRASPVPVRSCSEPWMEARGPTGEAVGDTTVLDSPTGPSLRPSHSPLFVRSRTHPTVTPTLMLASGRRGVPILHGRSMKR